ncbi:GNAT family N-acetyltransferase [uncultured Rhodoblastus sp.]|uniref:GNAT family N-acetyltransferase n=1 Tax=uncultured Rhodoblastus sp. TaxID=543037 RepID=UPI0025DFFEAC|nr:GNAT family N-acetyltransferase [uncultured Rhodoblastus sp.]
MFPELARDEVFRLETRRLWLRWPRPADAEALCELAGNPEAACMTATLPHPCRIEDAEYFIRRSREEAARGEALRFVVTLKSLPRSVIGAIGVEPRDGLPQLGYWLARSFRGMGYAREAAAAVTDAFFLLTGSEQLRAAVPPENTDSRGVLENLGFAPVERPKLAPGIAAQRAVLHFALPRGDWRGLGLARLRPGAGFDRAII